MNQLFNGMLQIVTELANAILSLLPRSPFRDFINEFSMDSSIQTYLGWLNWFFPVGRCVQILSLWLVAYGLFLLYSVVMRWVKML